MLNSINGVLYSINPKTGEKIYKEDAVIDFEAKQMKVYSDLAELGQIRVLAYKYYIEPVIELYREYGAKDLNSDYDIFPNLSTDEIFNKMEKESQNALLYMKENLPDFDLGEDIYDTYSTSTLDGEDAMVLAGIGAYAFTNKILLPFSYKRTLELEGNKETAIASAKDFKVRIETFFTKLKRLEGLVDSYTQWIVTGGSGDEEYDIEDAIYSSRIREDEREKLFLTSFLLFDVLKQPIIVDDEYNVSAQSKKLIELKFKKEQVDKCI